MFCVFAHERRVRYITRSKIYFSKFSCQKLKKKIENPIQKPKSIYISFKCGICTLNKIASQWLWLASLRATV